MEEFWFMFIGTWWGWSGVGPHECVWSGWCSSHHWRWHFYVWGQICSSSVCAFSTLKTSKLNILTQDICCTKSNFKQGELLLLYCWCPWECWRSSIDTRGTNSCCIAGWWWLPQWYARLRAHHCVKHIKVTRQGLEPRTSWIYTKRSNHWAIQPYWIQVNNYYITCHNQVTWDTKTKCHQVHQIHQCRCKPIKDKQSGRLHNLTQPPNLAQSHDKSSTRGP